MVACQLFLLNRSPHLEDLITGLFDHVRRHRLVDGMRPQHPACPAAAVSALGFRDAPRQSTGRHPARATGGAQAWQQWAGRWHATSTLTSRARGNVRVQATQGRPLAGGRTPRCRRSGGIDPADLRSLGGRAGPDERRRLRAAECRAQRPHRRRTDGGTHRTGRGSPAAGSTFWPSMRAWQWASTSRTATRRSTCRSPSCASRPARTRR